MRIYRILGVGWAAVCLFAIYLVFGFVRYLFWLDQGSISPALCIFIIVLLLLVAGAVASVFLYRGLAWARILLCIIAIVSLIYCGLSVASRFRSESFQSQAIFMAVGLYSLVSVVVLLIPKRYIA